LIQTRNWAIGIFGVVALVVGVLLASGAVSSAQEGSATPTEPAASTPTEAPAESPTDAADATPVPSDDSSGSGDSEDGSGESEDGDGRDCPEKEGDSTEGTRATDA
jgi:hypothetical protein